jgi:hypothetical protein
LAESLTRAIRAPILASGVLGFNEQNPAIYVPGDSTEANTQQRRINPLFGSVGLFSSDNDSHYESLRLNLEKRFSKGFTPLANYTHSRMLTGGSTTASPTTMCRMSSIFPASGRF